MLIDLPIIWVRFPSFYILVFGIFRLNCAFSIVVVPALLSMKKIGSIYFNHSLLDMGWEDALHNARCILYNLLQWSTRIISISFK